MTTFGNLAESEMDEFPFGTNMNGFDLLELEQELEELLANDESVYEDNEVEGRLMAPLQTAAPEIASAAVFFTCAMPLPYLCVGLFRHVYLTKCLVLFASSMLQVMNYLLTTMSNIDGRTKVSIGVVNHQEAFVGEKGKGFGFHFAFRTLSSLDEILSFFLFYELYQCTCHMKARVHTLLRFAKKMLIAFFISFGLHGLEKLSVFVLDIWWFLFLIVLDPAALLLHLGCTGAVIYLGVQILFALRKSNEFRKTNSLSDGKDTGKIQHLTLILAFVIVAQVIKFFQRLLALIISPIYTNKMLDCISNISMEEDAYLAEKRCSYYLKLAPILFSYLAIRFGSALEILSIIVLMARKKYKASNET